MKISFNKLKPYRMYGKTPTVLTPIGVTSKPNVGFTVFSVSTNKNFTFSITNKELFPPQYFRYYFYTKYVKIGGRIIRFNDREKDYKEIKNNGDSKFEHYVVKPETIHGKNIVVDMARALSTFDLRYTGRGRIKNQNFVNAIASEYETFLKENGKYYTHKPFIVIDTDDVMQHNENINTFFNVAKLKNPSVLQHFYFFLKSTKIGPEGSISDTIRNFLNNKFLFYSSKTKFFFMLDGITNELDWSKFNRNIKLMLKLNSKINLDSEELKELGIESEEQIEKETPATVSNENLKDTKVNEVITKFTQIFKLDNERDSLAIKKLQGDIETVMSKLPKKPSSEAEIVSALDNSKEFKTELKKLSHAKILGKAEIAGKRLDKNRKEAKVSDSVLDLKEILANFKEKEIQTEKINVTEGIAYDMFSESKLKDFEKSYNENQSKKDLAAILTSFADRPEFPMRLVDVERTNTSDDFNKKDTLKIKFSDIDNRVHTVTIDVPRFVNDKFLYLNGGKKSIVKQIAMLPIIKVKEDTVKITTNYNILHLIRFGSKIDSTVNVIKKISNGKVKFKGVNINIGSNKSKNKKFKSTTDFIELSTFINTMTIGKLKIDTNMQNLKSAIENFVDNTFLDDNNLCPIGLTTDKKEFYLMNLAENTVVIYDTNTSKLTETEFTLGEFINEYAKKQGLNDFSEALLKNKPPKKLAFTRVKILGREIPLSMIISSFVGFETFINKLSAKKPSEFKYLDNETDSKEIKTYKNNHVSYNTIKFKNKTLVYKNKIQYNLLLNAFAYIDTENYDLEELNTQEFYLEYFNDFLGSRNVQKGINNTLESLIDPITKDVLNTLDLPTNIIDVLIYSNSLLGDTSWKQGNDISSYRIRSNEIVNAHIYKQLSNAYIEYKQTTKNQRNSSKEITMSLPQNAVIKNLLEDQLINNFSILNPFLEAQDLGAATFRGIAGINMSDAIRQDTRSYDKSFIGILGLSSPDSDKVGTVRQLTYNPNIMNNRGMIKSGRDIDVTKEANAANMLTPVELLGPYTSVHSDPQRAQMFSTQSKHFMPTVKQSKPLIGTGVERTIKNVISDDFISLAKEPGKVIKVDNKLNLLTVEYKSGKKEIIDISERPAFNGNGGFYLANKKVTRLKEGQTFKKDDVLAKNEDYFIDNEYGDVTITNGLLSKAAITVGWFSFEDSCAVTTKLSEDMASYVTMKKVVKLGPNTTIKDIIKVGDNVKTGDSLVVFEESFDDSSINDLLNTVGEEFGDTIEEMSTNKIKSKYTGEVVDMVVRYSTDIPDLSPTLQELVKNYIGTVEEKRKLLEKSSNADNIILPPVAKVPEGTKVGGEEFEGVMIEIFIKYKEKMEVGAKLTSSIALKSIIAEVIPEGQEPFSEYHNEDPVDIIVSPLSIVNRMTTEIFNLGYGNKCLLELKRQVKDMYLGK